MINEQNRMKELAGIITEGKTFGDWEDFTEAMDKIDAFDKYSGSKWSDWRYKSIPIAIFKKHMGDPKKINIKTNYSNSDDKYESVPEIIVSGGKVDFLYRYD